LPGELLVLTDIGRHDPAQSVGGQEPAEAPVVDAAVVRHDLEIVDACL
jgi:hypothetical protein